MPTLTESIAGWWSRFGDLTGQFQPQVGIATETAPRESPEWDTCIDELRKIRSDASVLGDTPPNATAIDAGLRWIAYLRTHCPTAPPTCIIAEPGGGLIIDRRVVLSDGRESICELTFYNDGRAELTAYLNGRVESLMDISLNPETQVD
jgi:hypothetical protein